MGDLFTGVPPEQIERLRTFREDGDQAKARIDLPGRFQIG